MGLFDAVAREAAYLTAVGRTMRMMRALSPDSSRTIAEIVQEHAEADPARVAILHQERVVTYGALDEAANRYAHWAYGQGIRRGDVVVLLMENRPEYLMAWLGLIKVGAIAALINTNLRGAPLAHSISIASAKHAIIGHELWEQYSEALPLLSSPPLAWCEGGAVDSMQCLDSALAAVPGDPFDRSLRGDLTLKDKAFYIYTSGTTGMPKAANISHMRMLFMMVGFAGALNAKADDRMYNTLPLYHSAGGIAALGPPLLAGGSLVIRRKFSVHEFWDDCHRYQPTFFQYIGEICRYLLNAPPNPFERAHKLRAITGNGLRPEIWLAFQNRFAIPKIVEFYGATEGNVGLLNYDGKVGAVGRVPSYMRRLMHTRIVRFDIEHEVPVRGTDGCCIECDVNEVGEAIGKITDEPGRKFEGYTAEQESQKKVLRDVFEKGDSWFRTGDLMKRDEQGYFYFVDRIGDTFRWKGENVATSEVAEALGVVPGVLEANVYGVAVPRMEGRAGMAAIVAGPELDVRVLAQNLAGRLPNYARPVFIRLQPEIEITGTFKQRKIDLVEEGFDPSRIVLPLYWLNPETERYEALNATVYGDIVNGRAKL